MVQIESMLIKTDVTFVKILENVIIAGVGGHLHIFDKVSRKPRKTFHIFEGQKIYGVAFVSQLTECLIYGANKIKLYFCKLDLDSFEEVRYHTCSDWILTAKWVNSNDYIASVFMHNFVSLWTKDFQLLKNVSCSEKCLLYSACIMNDVWENLIILSGTVFSEVLVWKPSKARSDIHRLEGHKGVIFSIDYDPIQGLICSTSDDRSAKLWSFFHESSGGEIDYSSLQISLKSSLFGHAARVFRCQIIDKYIITAGEDSAINIWNVDCSLLNKIDAHQGATVWAIDYNKDNNVIVSGGGDCGVYLFSLEQNINKYELVIPKQEVCKKLVLIHNNDIVVITEKGVLLHYCNLADAWNEVAQYDDLKNYALLEVSPCRHFFALAGFYGTIIIYQAYFDIFKLKCNYQIESKSRIFSIHWLSSTTFLSCGVEGNLTLWQLGDSEIIKTNSFNLPVTKERWTTSAVIVNGNYIAVGDRKGNVYLYSLLKIEPIQIIKKAHNHLGVTSLDFYDNILISLGRNSVVRKFLFNEATETLTMFSSNKVPVTWLAAFYNDGNNQLLLSFMGNEFIMWDYIKRRNVLQFGCGGGHRSWDFNFSSECFNFAYIKDKIVHTLHADLVSILPLNLIEGYHTDEINSAVFLPFKSTHNGIFISGGEDTTLRINKLETKSDSTDFTSLNVLKAHLSNIRVVTSCKIYEDFGVEKYLIVSGGGRAQIILWELQVTLVNGLDLNVLCRECYSYYEHDINTPEVRVMDICTIVYNSQVVLISGCSDGTLKVYVVVELAYGYKLKLVKTIVYKLKCILKVFHIFISNHNIVITMATDGKIAFWDFTSVIEQSTTGTEFDVTPFRCIETHQSGVNSFSFKQLSTTRYIFLTGGDDNALIISMFNFLFLNETIKVELLHRYCDVGSHCAQITGTFIMENYILSTSIDQKLNIFQYKIHDDAITFTLVKKYDSSIPDIQGMECYQGPESVYVFLFGKGVELCEIRQL